MKILVKKNLRPSSGLAISKLKVIYIQYSTYQFSGESNFAGDQELTFKSLEMGKALEIHIEIYSLIR